MKKVYEHRNNVQDLVAQEVKKRMYWNWGMRNREQRSKEIMQKRNNEEGDRGG